MTARPMLRRPRAATTLCLAGALLLGACGDGDAGAADEQDGGANSASSDDVADEAVDEVDDADEGADSSASPTGVALPPNMPEGIPIPDGHLVLRASSLIGDDADDDLGEHVAVNIALGGTLEEQRAFYEAELTDAYGEVQHEDGVPGEAMRFQGEWFENGRVFISENEGHLDGTNLDSSHLPVLLTVQVWEHLEG